ARVERLLARHPARAVSKLFTAREAAYARARPHPARHYAARLAAKEAAYKALSGNELARAIGWREIEVVAGATGSPTLLLSGTAHRRATELCVTRYWLSLTHGDHTAVAVVILEGD